MKVILLQDVKSQGKEGDIIEVSKGYAANFLFPRKLAAPAEGNALNEAKQKKASEELRRQKALDKAKADQEALNGATIHIKVRAGEKEGKIFGSVTSKEIAQELEAQGYTVDKHSVSLKEPIKQLGRQMVDVKLYGGLTARVNVVVEAL